MSDGGTKGIPGKTLPPFLARIQAHNDRYNAAINAAEQRGRPMQLSAIGLALLKDLEGSRAKPYRDIAGLLTVGIGHLITKSENASGKLWIDGVPVRYAAGLTVAQKDELLRQDLVPIEAALARWGTAEAQAFTQGQHDALMCWLFNVGIPAFLASTLRKRLEAGDYAAVPEQLSRWVFAGGRISPGLQRRRAREIARWLDAS